MKKLQFEPLVISTFETTIFPLPKHSHTYYELVYIFKGHGIHQMNHTLSPYKTGDLFLISPDDEHYFDIRKSTRFCFIKFTDSYFKNNRHLSPDLLISTSPTAIMKKPLLKEIKLVFSEPCKTILRKTIENIIDYNCKKDISGSPLLFFQILSLFGLIQEASAKLNIQINNSNLDKEDLISYIHQHIYNPQKIRIENISLHFNISQKYFSAYFKRNFHISYRHYLNDYKLKLIEKRILSRQVTLKQIADEFGFTDESHLTNFFKKLRHISPSVYRQRA